MIAGGLTFPSVAETVCDFGLEIPHPDSRDSE